MKSSIYGLIIPLCLGSLWSQKALSLNDSLEETSVGVSSTSVTKGSSAKSDELKLKVKAGVGNFKSTSFSQAGYIQTTSLQAEVQRQLRLEGEIPLMNGTKNNQNVSEMGNLKLSGAYLGLASRYWQFVPEFQVSFRNTNAHLSNRHDTYTPSVYSKYQRRRFSLDARLSYSLRQNEQDPLVDIGDMQSVAMGVQYQVSRPLSVRLASTLMRSSGVRTKDFIIARDAWLNLVQPSMRYDLGESFWLQVQSNLPTWRSRSLQETEVAFWDPEVPNPDSVTWRTELGVQF